MFRAVPLIYRCGTAVYITVMVGVTQGNSAPGTSLVWQRPDFSQNKLHVRIISIEFTATGVTS